MILDRQGTPMFPGVVAGLLLVTPASMTSLFDTLERRGLVTRRHDPDDRRRVLVGITEAGRVLVDQFVPEAIALSGAVMEDLSAAERRQLVRLLGKVQAAPAGRDGDAIVSAVPPRRRRADRQG